jgi:hypothetical protein
MDRRIAAVRVLCACVALAMACCHRPAGQADETATRLRTLLFPLIDYVEETQRDGTGPAGEKGFKSFLAGLSEQKRGDLQIGSTETLLVSPRDRQPFVIDYTISTTGGAAPAAWERTGVDGRRYVVFLDARVDEVDDEAFRKMGLDKAR